MQYGFSGEIVPVGRILRVIFYIAGYVDSDLSHRNPLDEAVQCNQGKAPRCAAAV